MFMLMDALRRTPCVKLRVDMGSSVAWRVVVLRLRRALGGASTTCAS